VRQIEVAAGAFSLLSALSLSLGLSGLQQAPGMNLSQRGPISSPKVAQRGTWKFPFFPLILQAIVQFNLLSGFVTELVLCSTFI